MQTIGTQNLSRKIFYNVYMTWSGSFSCRFFVNNSQTSCCYNSPDVTLSSTDSTAFSSRGGCCPAGLSGRAPRTSGETQQFFPAFACIIKGVLKSSLVESRWCDIKGKSSSLFHEKSFESHRGGKTLLFLAFPLSETWCQELGAPACCWHPWEVLSSSWWLPGLLPLSSWEDYLPNRELAPK